MFGSEDQLDSRAVDVVFTDGRRSTGSLKISYGSNLSRLLNGTTIFLEFESHNGEVSLIAKSTIASVTETEVPKASKLKNATAEGGDSPYEILGVANDASPLDIRNAYVELARRYHPDSHANSKLPPEVQDYMSNAFQRVNFAYNAISSEILQS